MFKVDKFNVRIVNAGDKYGRNDCITHEGEQLVEFYDSRYDFADTMGRGQFVSRYYTKTLLSGEYLDGLCLHGGVPAWEVGPEDMQKVLAYVKSQQKEAA